MKGKKIIKSENLAFCVSVVLDAFEVSTFGGGVVTDVCLLLFVDLPCVDDFFDCACGDKTIYFYVSLLTDTVCSVLSLKIVTWVPVWIKDDDFIC